MGDLIAAAFAAVVLALLVAVAPRWGGAILTIVVLLMLTAGVQAGTLSFPETRKGSP